MQVTNNGIEMIMRYWNKTDVKKVKRWASKVNKALNKCVKVRLTQAQWDTLLTMFYGIDPKYVLDEKNETIRGINKGEDWIPKDLFKKFI